MANGNPFYVDPGPGYGSQLAGLGQTIAQIGKEKKAQARFEAAKTAMQNAWASKDPDEMMQVAIDYPETSETVKQLFGVTNDRTGKASLDTYRSIMADPKNTEKYLITGINRVSEAGGQPDNMLADLGLYRRDPQAAIRKMQLSYAAADPRGYAALSAADKAARKKTGEDDTAGIKDFHFYQELKKTDPEAAAAFGRERGYISDEGQELSVHMQKRLSEANDQYIKASGDARGFRVLADEFEKAAPSAGLAGSWGEMLKKATGSQDAVSEMRKRYNAIKASQVVNNLPPGAASDADVTLALSGFPPDNANPKHLASFLRGLAALQDANAEFNDFKANFISENGSERGMLEKWKLEKDIKPAGTGNVSETTETVVIENHPKYGNVTEADIQETMTASGMTREQVLERLKME